MVFNGGGLRVLLTVRALGDPTPAWPPAVAAANASPSRLLTMAGAKSNCRCQKGWRSSGRPARRGSDAARRLERGHIWAPPWRWPPGRGHPWAVGHAGARVTHGSLQLWAGACPCCLRRWPPPPPSAPRVPCGGRGDLLCQWLAWRLGGPCGRRSACREECPSGGRRGWWTGGGRWGRCGEGRGRGGGVDETRWNKLRGGTHK